jgi:membrane-associated phospholipid phosphatase
MEALKNIFDYIGYMGPIITSIITITTLLDKQKYLISFIFGSIINNFLNEYLKNWIKQPRPQNPIPYMDDDRIKGVHIYGMPSGHAQIVVFTVTFLYLTKGNHILLLISLFIAILTLYQRWSFRRHTVEQLIIGSITGASFAYLLFFTTKKYLE